MSGSQFNLPQVTRIRSVVPITDMGEVHDTMKRFIERQRQLQQEEGNDEDIFDDDNDNNNEALSKAVAMEHVRNAANAILVDYNVKNREPIPPEELLEDYVFEEDEGPPFGEPEEEEDDDRKPSGADADADSSSSPTKNESATNDERKKKDKKKKDKKKDKKAHKKPKSHKIKART